MQEKYTSPDSSGYAHAFKIRGSEALRLTSEGFQTARYCRVLQAAFAWAFCTAFLLGTCRILFGVGFPGYRQLLWGLGLLSITLSLLWAVCRLRLGRLMSQARQLKLHVMKGSHD